MFRALARSSFTVRRAGDTLLPRAAPFSTAAKDAAGTTAVKDSVTHDEFEVNHLAGKNTRDHIHSAFASRAMAAVKYEYFAQRAELECELDAAALFKGLGETAKQQSMGYLELMEDYGDADFGLTLDNLEVSAQNEREDAEEKYPKFAQVAATEQLDQVDQWFQDMSEASNRAAERLHITASLMEPEEFGEVEGEAEDDVPTK